MTQEQQEYRQYGGKKIHTFTGWFMPDEPVFNVEDIAHGLANICRYGGQCKHFYSVAEHSLLVAGIMAEFKLGDPFEGLMHDAAEAYVGDIPNPFKARWTSHLEDEHRIESAIRAQFKLPAEKSAGCHRADKLALLVESNFLLWDKGVNIVDVLGVRDQAMELIRDHWKVHGFAPDLGSHLWMKGFKHYGPKIEVVGGDVEMQAARAESGKVVEGSSLVIP